MFINLRWHSRSQGAIPSAFGLSPTWRQLAMCACIPWESGAVQRENGGLESVKTPVWLKFGQDKLTEYLNWGSGRSWHWWRRESTLVRLGHSYAVFYLTLLLVRVSCWLTQRRVAFLWMDYTSCQNAYVLSALYVRVCPWMALHSGTRKQKRKGGYEAHRNKPDPQDKLCLLSGATSWTVSVHELPCSRTQYVGFMHDSCTAHARLRARPPSLLLGGKSCMQTVIMHGGGFTSHKTLLWVGQYSMTTPRVHAPWSNLIMHILPYPRRSANIEWHSSTQLTRYTMPWQHYDSTYGKLYGFWELEPAGWVPGTRNCRNLRTEERQALGIPRDGEVLHVREKERRQWHILGPYKTASAGTPESTSPPGTAHVTASWAVTLQG